MNSVQRKIFNLWGWKTLRTAAMLLVTLCIACSMALSAQAATADRTIRVGCFSLNGFFDIADDGSVTGYGADYMDAVASHAGWSYEYVRYSSWVDALDALSKNEIDILAPAQRTPEREAKYSFDSFPIGTEYGALVTRNTESMIYEDFSSFDGLKVGCVSSLVFLDDFEDYQERNGFSVRMTYYKDTDALLTALRAGEVDAAVVNMMVKTASMKLLARFGTASFYYMLSEQASDLRGPLNVVIDKLNTSHPDFQNELSEQYFSHFSDIPFSKEELDYIAQSETLAVACGGEYPPFSYTDSETGEITGVDRAILQEISKITGLKFSYQSVPFDKTEVQDFVKKQHIALLAGVENNEHTSLRSSQFTEPYLTVNKYFVGLTATNFEPTEQMNIAFVSAADALISQWHALYPTFRFNRYASVQECMDAVRSGEADALLNDRYSMKRLLDSPRNQDLQFLPTEGIAESIRFKVTRNENGECDQMLLSILNKAIRQIPSSNKDMYISDYVQATQYQYSVADFIYQYRMMIALVVLLVAVIGIAACDILRERRRVRREIAGNEIKLRHITNNINGGVIVLKADKGLEITFANDGFLELIGCTRQQFDQGGEGSYLAYVHPDDLHKIQQAIECDGTEVSMELRVLKADGSYLPALFNCTAGQRLDGEKELYCVILDMTAQNRLLEQLKIENRRTELILERVEEIFYEVNFIDGTISTSRSFMEKLGWKLPEVIEARSKEGFLNMWHVDSEDVGKLYASTREMLADKKPVGTMVRVECKPEHRNIWCEILQYPILAQDGTVVTVIGLIRNVDEQIMERERLIKQAQLDTLTGLYNKEAFEKIVLDTLEEMPAQNHALIFIDLDHFKSLNDTLGHMIGDRAICEAADKLKLIFSNFDVLSRFGGDEFCIFVKNIPRETLRGKMEWLVEKMHADYHGAKGTVRITCSCGVACTEQVGFEYRALMTCADEALYRSKETGRDRFTFYSDSKK